MIWKNPKGFLSAAYRCLSAAYTNLRARAEIHENSRTEVPMDARGVMLQHLMRVYFSIRTQIGQDTET